MEIYVINLDRRQDQLRNISAVSGNVLILEDDAVLDERMDWKRLLSEADDYMTRTSIDVLQLGFIQPVYRTKTQKVILKTWAATRAALRLLYKMLFEQPDRARYDR